MAVDDLFSGIQLAVDVEILEYVRELIESFTPHPDITSTDGLFEIIKNVALTDEEFYSHRDTAMKVRKLLPVSKRRPSEKLRSWMLHEKHMKDRLREECLNLNWFTSLEEVRAIIKDSGVKAMQRQRMQYLDRRKEAAGQAEVLFPSEVGFLAPPPERAQPKPAHFVEEPP